MFEGRVGPWPEVTRRKNVAENTLARRSPLGPHKCYDKNGLGENRTLEGSTSGATKHSKCRRTPDLNQPHSFRKELSQALQADSEQHSKSLAGIFEDRSSSVNYRKLHYTSAEEFFTTCFSIVSASSDCLPFSRMHENHFNIWDASPSMLSRYPRSLVHEHCTKTQLKYSFKHENLGKFYWIHCAFASYG